MDHAEAHERLGDLALEPERLAALDHDPAPVASALRAHLEGCDDCQLELESLRRTEGAIHDAFAGSAETGPPAPQGRRASSRARSSADISALPRKRSGATASPW